jgi:RecB family exonuclease
MLECYLDEFLKSPAKIVGIEKRFDANIGKYRFCGIIDRIDQHPDGSYEIIDYKTHPVAWDQETVDEDIQLSFYAYASKSVFGIRPDKIAIHFIACAKKIYTKRTAEQMREAIDMAIDAAVKIRNDEFPALPQKCPVCTFVDKCPRSVAAQP